MRPQVIAEGIVRTVKGAVAPLEQRLADAEFRDEQQRLMIARLEAEHATTTEQLRITTEQLRILTDRVLELEAAAAARVPA